MFLFIYTCWVCTELIRLLVAIRHSRMFLSEIWGGFGSRVAEVKKKTRSETQPGWWFKTWLLCSIIYGNNHPIWQILFKMVKTTNQDFVWESTVRNFTFCWHVAPKAPSLPISLCFFFTMCYGKWTMYRFYIDYRCFCLPFENSAFR
jgi:hypothetical protein